MGCRVDTQCFLLFFPNEKQLKIGENRGLRVYILNFSDILYGLETYLPSLREEQ